MKKKISFLLFEKSENPILSIWDKKVHLWHSGTSAELTINFKPGFVMLFIIFRISLIFTTGLILLRSNEAICV